MRSSALVVMTIVFIAASSGSGWSCPPPPPRVDPCQRLSSSSPSESSESPATEGDGPWMEMDLETVEVVTVGSRVETAEDDEEEDLKAEAVCQDARLSLRDRDPEVRRAALDEVIEGAVPIEDCLEAVDVLRQRLQDEEDPFLLYRTIEALGEALEEPIELLDFLENASADIRRKTAEILEGEIFEPDQADRVLSAMKREPDSWIRLAMARLEPEGKEAEVGDLLLDTVRDGGPTAPAALKSLWSVTEAMQPILQAVERPGPVRLAALEILGANAKDARARHALVRILQEGSQKERLYAASALMSDASAEESAEWLRALRDPALPLQFRSALLLQPGLSDTWRTVACQAKMADPALFSFVEQVLADPTLDPPEIPLLPAVDREPPVEGTVQGEGGASVRCATRPFGPPRSDETRLFAGRPIVADDAFTQEGVAWVRDKDGCWLPKANLNTSGPPDMGAPEVLEADVPLSVVSSLGAALAAGDLELFDPIEGFTGIRLRGAVEDVQLRWRSGQEGVLQVLAAVETDAQRRASELAQNR